MSTLTLADVAVIGVRHLAGTVGHTIVREAEGSDIGMGTRDFQVVDRALIGDALDTHAPAGRGNDRP